MADDKKRKPFHMRFLPDEPITHPDEDVLGLGDFVDLIHSAIASTQTPFVYGVLGDWGVGKTSILRLLQFKYADQNPGADEAFIVPIWFNAWEYENEASLIYPLLYAIKTHYEENVHPGEDDTLKTLWRSVVTGIFMLGDIGLRAATNKLSGEAVGITDIEERYETIMAKSQGLDAIFSDWVNVVANLKGAFSDLLDAYAVGIARKYSVPADRVTFLILIDDLDRCLPDTTINILEGIKNYLTVDRVVYMLGLNARVVYQGIRHKYGNLEISGREYLEKILNYTFYVPEPELEPISQFAEKRIGQLVTDDGQREELRPHFVTFGRIIRDCGFNNPRKIKRILNRYLLFLGKYEDTLNRHDMSNIVRLLIIAEYFPEIFQLLLNDTEYYRKRVHDLLDQHNQGDEHAPDVKNFEDETGVSLKGIYPQLARMRKLFTDLREARSIDEPNLSDQVYAVFSITRLI